MIEFIEYIGKKLRVKRKLFKKLQLKEVKASAIVRCSRSEIEFKDFSAKAFTSRLTRNLSFGCL
jgi:hypothetical protein